MEHSTKSNKRCEHNKIRSVCKDCGGGSICCHNKERSKCKDCGGSQICQHNKMKSQCKDCGGSRFCEHNKQRSHCKDCNGSQICEHNKRRSICKDCGGSQVCQHNKIRRECGLCGGSAICKSRLEPYNTGCQTRGNRKLNGFCAYCFPNLFPDDPRTLSIRKKSKELQVVSHNHFMLIFRVVVVKLNEESI